MVSLDRKGKMAIAFLVSLIIVVVSIIVIFFVIKPLPEGIVNKVTLCQITNTIRTSTYITQFIPNVCSPIVVDEPVSGSEEKIMEEMAGYMRDCWTMWMRGKRDFGVSKPAGWVMGFIPVPDLADKPYTCYVFKIEDKNILLEDFVYYLQTHWNDKKSDKNTYWNYIEEGEGTKNICIDRNLLNEGFKKDETYYIKFMDDREEYIARKIGQTTGFLLNNDRILVSNNKDFGKVVIDLRELACISVTK